MARSLIGNVRASSSVSSSGLLTSGLGASLSASVAEKKPLNPGAEGL
jgi:hypothetical protein